jgi:4-amino-4-deoxy-L-arabinose transferase-like glycosyltransferase
MRRPAAVRDVYAPLLALVLAGVALRIWASVAFAPAVMNLADSADYIVHAHTSVFNDVVRPAGYPIFLKVIGWTTSSAFVPILLQHLVGVGTGLLAFALVRLAGGPRWAAAIPAAFVLLSMDQVMLEHSYMPEALFTVLVLGAAYSATRALMTSRAADALTRSAAGWLAAAGALLGLAAYVRTVALPMAPFLVLWALLALPKPWWRSRLAGAGVVLAAVLVMALGYSLAHDLKNGFFGFTPYGGWATYIRTAQFADCEKFDPPEGTRRLCERVPSAARPGPDFYAWQAGSPARIAFGAPPNGSGKLGAFGREAIIHQPFTYLETGFKDFVRFFAPSWNSDRPYSGPGPEVLDFNRRAPEQEAAIVQDLNLWYASTRLRVRDGWASAFQDLQQLLRIRGIVLFGLVLLGLAGLVASRGTVRATIALLLGAGILLLAIPAATAVFNPRYAVPAAGLLAAAAALGASTLWEGAASRPRTS